ncbi:MAG TPA: DNA polymerase Y family protein, partial [Gammaproteobacteria bacterium]|nr:DNA polymerase Y family protein [Gammaproteobacteria bacterium]
FKACIQFDYPVTDTAQLGDPMQQLLEDLVGHLQKQQQQCHAIQWRLYGIHQNRQDITVSTERIHSQWQLPWDLSMIQLERIVLAFEVDKLELVCGRTTALVTENHTLLGRQISDTANADSERLFARLAARLGKQSLGKLKYYDDFFPENCQQLTNVTQSSQPQLIAQQIKAPRPSWLFQPPQAIQYRNKQLFWHEPLQLLQGPERLRGHWWNAPCARDYFMAMRSDYVRCWVYQDLLSGQWYVHGVFA